jgi:hypothetical protein
MRKSLRSLDMKLLRFVPAVASFVLAAGLQVSGYQSVRLGIGLMVVGVLLLVLAAYPWLSRLRLRIYLAPLSGVSKGTQASAAP